MRGGKPVDSPGVLKDRAPSAVLVLAGDEGGAVRPLEHRADKAFGAQTPTDPKR